MKATLQLFVALLLALLALDAQAAGAEALYSFSDVYRLTVSGALGAESPLAPAPAVELTPVAQSSSEFQSRAAAAEPPAPGYQFSIAAVREPQRGLLLLSGLALMVWVARRRLIQSF
jgi:hypothetical protein